MWIQRVGEIFPANLWAGLEVKILGEHGVLRSVLVHRSSFMVLRCDLASRVGDLGGNLGALSPGLRLGLHSRSESVLVSAGKVGAKGRDFERGALDFEIPVTVSKCN